MAFGKKTGGGSRKGSPNKSTLEIKTIIDAVVDFKVVVSKLYELSKGIKVEGNDGVYQKEPDPTAAKILMEYRFGKPHQALDVTSDGQSIAPQIIIKNV